MQVELRFGLDEEAVLNRWETPIVKLRLLLVVGVAVSMTLAAELFLLTVWGLWMFPGGNLFSKFVWAIVCGIAMGALISLAILIFVEGVFQEIKAIIAAAGIVTLIGSLCAILCSQIDLRFNYFGGESHTLMFILSGIIPAIFGGFLYGWLLYSSRIFDAHFDRQLTDR